MPLTMRILFVEDEPELRMMGSDMMEMAGHEVVAASGVIEAENALLDRGPFDLVVSDHRLPDGFGIHFVMESRTLFPALDFIIVSGYVSPREERILAEEGIRCYHKPVSYLQVLNDYQAKRPAASRN